MSRSAHQPFTVLFEGRSGSTYLIETLQQHSRIVAEKERLATMRKRKRTGAEQVAWARHFLTQERDSLTKAVGFKTKLGDVLDPPGFGDLLQSIDAKIVLLRRRNRVKLVVSLHNAIRLAEATGDWNLYRSDDRLPPEPIDRSKFEAWLQRSEKRFRELGEYAETLSLPTLELYYEDILVDPDRAVQRVCSFLGVPPEDIEGAARKHTSDDLRHAVPNFEELRAAYEGSKYEWMFDEVLVR